MSILLKTLINQSLETGHLNSNNKLSSQCRPQHALKILQIASFYLDKLLTKGCSLSVTGALHKYPKVDKTELNLLNSEPSTEYSILSNISVSKIRSSIKGAASSESSHTLYTTKVCFPFINIDEQYSSIAFLESPELGTYLITISWSILVDTGKRILFEANISSTHDFLDNSLELNYL